MVSLLMAIYYIIKASIRRDMKLTLDVIAFNIGFWKGIWEACS